MGLPSDFPFDHTPVGADEATALASQAWSQIARLFISQQHRREEVADSLGLHVSDLIALFHFPPGEPVSQRALAEHWACDPSWVTNRVDRLEQLGYVQRRLSPTDRRVKEVWLTESGEATRQRGMEGFAAAPEVLTDLKLTDLRALAKILAKLDVPDPTRVPSPLAVPSRG
jgi:DNA-binding MarR family transcriptional regulator